MQLISPCIWRKRVRLHGLLSSPSGSVPTSGAGSRIVQRHGNQRLAHSSAAVFPHRAFLQVLAVLVVTLGLLNLPGCSGGFQGYRPVALTVTQPASITVPLGQTATFSVSATGTGTITYQWFKNGVAISGATSSSYTTPPTVAGDTGSLFTVTVTDSTGSVTSPHGTLTVQLPSLLAGSLVPSSATPPYNSSVFLVPTFSGGTAVIGSTGVGSSDITNSAVSGGSYPTPLLTSAKTFTLTVTDSQGNVVFTTCLVTPGTVSISPISPGQSNSRSRPDSLFRHRNRRLYQQSHVDCDWRNVHRQRVDCSHHCGYLHHHRHQRGPTIRFGYNHHHHQRPGHQHSTSEPAHLHQQRTLAFRRRILRHQLSMEAQRHRNPWRHQFDLLRGFCVFRQCWKLFRHRHQWRR